jgi:hypothetical protein
MLCGLMFEKLGVDSTGSGYDLMADFCEQLIGLPDCVNLTNFFTSRVTVRLLKKGPAP